MNNQESQRVLHSLGVPFIIDEEQKVYIVRISPQRRGPVFDYSIMKEKLIQGDDSEWDSDKNNRIQKQDWLGFIIGDTIDATVELYQVKDILSPKHRPSHWASKKYTSQKITSDVCTRNVIQFEMRAPFEYSWNEWKYEVNYSNIYMPRGTISARHPFK